METQNSIRKQFLIVENDPNDAFFIRRAILSLSSCRGSTLCRNLSEAKAYLQGAGMYADREKYPFPDAILSDMRLERESGLELLMWIRLQTYAEIPVVILTGSATLREIDAAKKLGARKVYSKPGRLEDLQVLLHKVVGELNPHGERPQEDAGQRERPG